MDGDGARAGEVCELLCRDSMTTHMRALPVRLTGVAGFTAASRRGGAEPRRRLGPWRTRFQSLASPRAPRGRQGSTPQPGRSSPLASGTTQLARVRHHPADVVAFAEVAATWLTKARAVLAQRHRRRGIRHAAWAGRFRAFAKRRMVELVRSWDDAHTKAPYARHARERRTVADLFAALLVGTADNVVALVEDGELSRVAGGLSSKGMGDLCDPAILAQLRDKHPSRAVATPKRRVGEYARRPGLRRSAPCRRSPQWTSKVVCPGSLTGSSPRLVAPVKKLGEGGAPDVRHVAVGEAERRALDNMKEAYVSVLALSQLNVGISARDDYVLIHGVRLIAEKLSRRAVIVHTELRNAYNESMRHGATPSSNATSIALVLYTLSSRRSWPPSPRLRFCSWTIGPHLCGRMMAYVQYGTPLATTSLCIAIHYDEVQGCDITLEVIDGAARFNADDRFLVGLPERVWSAIYAFSTSIKAAVWLQVRVDKMHTYNADMEAAWHEVPPDIEWPELDGHHGFSVLIMLLGSPR
eukprot:jgi/Tetstr1/449113/TSEL_036325.t1